MILNARLRSMSFFIVQFRVQLKMHLIECHFRKIIWCLLAAAELEEVSFVGRQVDYL
jgi:hypothetical protein